MLECLVGVVIAAIIVLVLLWVIELVLGSFQVTPPPPVLLLLRLAGALIVLIYALRCFGIVSGGVPRIVP